MAEEHRKHIRLYLNCVVFIELESIPVEGQDPGEIALCKTLDVSYGGLKVSLSRELPVGAILAVGVELPAFEQTLNLVAEVMWCRPHGGSDWAAGFQLLNAEDSDIQRWRELMEHV